MEVTCDVSLLRRHLVINALHVNFYELLPVELSSVILCLRVQICLFAIKILVKLFSWFVLI
jgi:hypothetical protein